MKAVLDDDGESDVPREERDGESGLSAWRKPEFLVQMLFLLGAVVGFYLLSERRTTTLEVVANRIDGQMASIVSSVQSLTNKYTEQQGEINSLKEQLRTSTEAAKEAERELKGEIAGLKAHIDVLRSGQAKLDARTERMR